VPYANRAAKDFTLPAGSACATLLARGSGDIPSDTPPVVAPPAGSTGSGGGGNGKGKGGPKRSAIKVTFRGRAKRHGKVRVSGRVRAGLHAAAVIHRRVRFQVRLHGAWYRVASARVRASSFRSTVRLPRHLRGRTLVMRAAVPRLGTSKRVRLRSR
jgi:hypothetical protein